MVTDDDRRLASEIGQKGLAALGLWVKSLAQKALGFVAVSVASIVLAFFLGMMPPWNALQWAVFVFLELALIVSAFFFGKLRPGRAFLLRMQEAHRDTEDVIVPYVKDTACEVTRSRTTKRPLSVHGFLCRVVVDGQECRTRLSSAIAMNEYFWRCEKQHDHKFMPHHSALTSTALQTLDKAWRGQQPLET